MVTWSLNKSCATIPTSVPFSKIEAFATFSFYYGKYFSNHNILLHCIPLQYFDFDKFITSSLLLLLYHIYKKKNSI